MHHLSAALFHKIAQWRLGEGQTREGDLRVFPHLDQLPESAPDVIAPSRLSRYRTAHADDRGCVGGVQDLLACWTESQLPSRTPFDATRFTRVMPVASSGASD